MKTFEEILGIDCFDNTHYNKYTQLTDTTYLGCHQVFDEDLDVIFAHEVKLEIKPTGLEIKMRKFSASIWLDSTHMGSAHYDEAADFIEFDNTNKLNRFIESWQDNGIPEFMSKKETSFGINCFSEHAFINKRLHATSHSQAQQTIEDIKTFLQYKNIEIVVHQHNARVDVEKRSAIQDAIEFVYDNSTIIIEMNWIESETETWPTVYINDNKIPFHKNDTLNNILK